MSRKKQKQQGYPQWIRFFIYLLAIVGIGMLVGMIIPIPLASAQELRSGRNALEKKRLPTDSYPLYKPPFNPLPLSTEQSQCMETNHSSLFKDDFERRLIKMSKIKDFQVNFHEELAVYLKRGDLKDDRFEEVGVLYKRYMTNTVYAPLLALDRSQIFLTYALQTNDVRGLKRLFHEYNSDPGSRMIEHFHEALLSNPFPKLEMVTFLLDSIKKPLISKRLETLKLFSIKSLVPSRVGKFTYEEFLIFKSLYKRYRQEKVNIPDALILNMASNHPDLLNIVEFVKINQIVHSMFSKAEMGSRLGMFTSASYAVFKKHFDYFESFLDDDEYNILLLNAIAQEDLDITQKLLSFKKEINQHPKVLNTPFAAACYLGNIDLLKAFMVKRNDLDLLSEFFAKMDPMQRFLQGIRDRKNQDSTDIPSLIEFFEDLLMAYRQRNHPQNAQIESTLKDAEVHFWDLIYALNNPESPEKETDLSSWYYLSGIFIASAAGLAYYRQKPKTNMADKIHQAKKEPPQFSTPKPKKKSPPAKSIQLEELEEIDSCVERVEKIFESYNTDLKSIQAKVNLGTNRAAEQIIAMKEKVLTGPKEKMPSIQSLMEEVEDIERDRESLSNLYEKHLELTRELAYKTQKGKKKEKTSRSKKTHFTLFKEVPQEEHKIVLKVSEKKPISSPSVATQETKSQKNHVDPQLAVKLAKYHFEEAMTISKSLESDNQLNEKETYFALFSNIIGLIDVLSALCHSVPERMYYLHQKLKTHRNALAKVFPYDTIEAFRYIAYFNELLSRFQTVYIQSTEKDRLNEDSFEKFCTYLFDHELSHLIQIHFLREREVEEEIVTFNNCLGMITKLTPTSNIVSLKDSSLTHFAVVRSAFIACSQIHTKLSFIKTSDGTLDNTFVKLKETRNDWMHCGNVAPEKLDKNFANLLVSFYLFSALLTDLWDEKEVVEVNSLSCG